MSEYASKSLLLTRLKGTWECWPSLSGSIDFVGAKIESLPSTFGRAISQVSLEAVVEPLEGGHPHEHQSGDQEINAICGKHRILLRGHLSPPFSMRLVEFKVGVQVDSKFLDLDHDHKYHAIEGAPRCLTVGAEASPCLVVYPKCPSRLIVSVEAALVEDDDGVYRVQEDTKVCSATVTINVS